METTIKKELFGYQMESLYRQESTDREIKGCNQVRKASIRQFVWKSNGLEEIYDPNNKYIFSIYIQHTDNIDPTKWFDSRYESIFGTQNKGGKQEALTDTGYISEEHRDKYTLMVIEASVPNFITLF